MANEAEVCHGRDPVRHSVERPPQVSRRLASRRGRRDQAVERNLKTAMMLFDPAYVYLRPVATASPLSRRRICTVQALPTWRVWSQDAASAGAAIPLDVVSAEWLRRSGMHVLAFVVVRDVACRIGGSK